MWMRTLAALLGWLLLAATPAAPIHADPSARGRSSWLFESGPVRPVALSPDGRRLYVANVPDAHLEVFAVASGGLRHLHSVPVGLEPVTVAPHPDGRVWVVNHLSDSISIVDPSADPPRVVRTLQVGDEPRDLVFAGAGASRALVATAHRGQHSPYPTGEHRKAGIGRADVWVFDVGALGKPPGGEPLAILTLFGDTPRALAVGPDGDTVYAAVFHSGNRTASVHELAVCDGGAQAPPCEFEGARSPGGLPAPNTNVEGVPGPEVGLVVAHDPATGAWLDELGRDWREQVLFDLPDYDVFGIDVRGAVPRPNGERYSGVGTTLFNLRANPVTGALYVSNTEARNRVRFEGPGIHAAAFKPEGEPASVRGHLAEARITVIRDGNVTPHHLNPHIPYGSAPMPPDVADRSLSMPLDMAISADGRTLYVAAFGSAKVGIVDTAALEAGRFEPDPADHVEVPGGGPAGLALDEAAGRLYVLTRFDNAVVAVDLERRAVVQRLPLHDPEPESVRAGRPFLYDARRTSSNGEASCASCHVFGDWDGLVWDLGDPDGAVTENVNVKVARLPAELPDFHPLKGPMATQTMRGLAHHGSQHWRGDRQGDAEAAFKAFDVAFGGLVGRDEGGLEPRELQAFADFALELTMPPNPGRRLDGSLRYSEALGRRLFHDKPAFFTAGGIKRCNDCHERAPALGRFGTGTRSSPSGVQPLKIPQLRNIYQKAGASGTVGVTGHTGPQIRATGLGHAGFLGSTTEFFSSRLFMLSDEEEEQLADFVAVFDTTLAPVVGQQTTRRAAGAEANARLQLLERRAATPFVLKDAPDARECDLVATGVVEGEPRSWLRGDDGRYQPDRRDAPPLDPADLRALADDPGHALTFTCVPPGSGPRMGLDRDGDGVWNGDELRDGSDPADPRSFARACSDGLDNDGDGWTDADDPGCGGPGSLAEDPDCSDGLDNDGDGTIDYPDDPSCEGVTGTAELGPARPARLPAAALGVVVLLVAGLVAVALRRLR